VNAMVAEIAADRDEVGLNSPVGRGIGSEFKDFHSKARRRGSSKTKPPRSTVTTS